MSKDYIKTSRKNELINSMSLIIKTLVMPENSVLYFWKSEFIRHLMRLRILFFPKNKNWEEQFRNDGTSFFRAISSQAGVVTFLILTVIFYYNNAQAQSKTIDVNHFDKVIVSPHIQVTFVQGDQEVVTIEKASVPLDKLNIEVNGKTLRIYLDGAKMVTKSEKIKGEGRKRKQSIYKGTIVTATVTYTNLEELSLRGEETFVCKSPLVQEKFRLAIYGESKVYLEEVQLEKLQATIYGESYLEIKAGAVTNQKFRAYGESKINGLEIKNKNTQISAYGSSSFRLKILDNLKITAFGESNIRYTGDPVIDMGIIIGDVTIQNIDE